MNREYYVMQGEFYTAGKNGEPGLQPFSMEKAIDEKPDYVVFNGSVGSLTGDKALTAKTGETVRLFIGNGGPNLISSFHVIGEIFDKVRVEGGDVVNANRADDARPGGRVGHHRVQSRSAGHADSGGSFDLPHLQQGLARDAQGRRTGGHDDLLRQAVRQVYQPGGRRHPDGGRAGSGGRAGREQGRAHRRTASGSYSSICAACHQPSGLGIPVAFPPLAGSDYLNADKKRAIATVVRGLSGAITVNGQPFNSVMPALGLSDEDVANALTFVYSQWGNAGHEVTPGEVKAVRAEPVK